MTPRVFIDGEAGTTGLQIRQRLESRDDIELLSIPHELRKDGEERAKFLNAADVAILCLPDDAAREAVVLASDMETRIIDASTAFRTDPNWAYGFPEMQAGHNETISKARFVANPGCYPTGAIAMLRPLVNRGVMPADYPVAIHAISGYSGGGRKMIEQFESTDSPDAITAPYFLYGLQLAHKHIPEIYLHCGLSTRPIFVPSVARFKQGMIVQVGIHTSQLNNGTTPEDIHSILSQWFHSCRHVTVAPLNEQPAGGKLDPERFNGTNDMALHVFGSETGDQCLIAAVLDNLGKGASGAAVQNLNLMLGLDASLGLDCAVAA